MLLSEAISKINSGDKPKDLAKEIGVGEKKFRAALKDFGYSFNNSSKVWEYVGTDEEPQEINVFDYISQQKGSRVKRNSPKNSQRSEKDSQTNSPLNESSSHKDSHSGETKFTFTEEEFNVLRQIARERIKQTREQSQRERLHARIMRLETESKTRKTIVIDSEIGERFDKFADKTKLNKSDLIALALSDFMNLYEE